jgi:hypothetical protein
MDEKSFNNDSFDLVPELAPHGKSGKNIEEIRRVYVRAEFSSAMIVALLVAVRLWITHALLKEDPSRRR